MQIRDSVLLDASGLSLTRDGYLTGDAKVSRAGNVQHYMGSEIGLVGEMSSVVYGVYRDPDVVFDSDSMLSLAGRPVTRGHPPHSVTADNWKELTIGQVGGTIKRDGDHVVAPMAIMDSEAVKEVQSGARSLSAGYTCQIVKDEGVTPDGEAYQYRQAGPLRFNHVAYLPDNNPRAGNTRIGDSWGGTRITDFKTKSGNQPIKTGGRMPDLKTIVLGDKAVQVLDTDVSAIEQFKTDSNKALADANTTISTKDEEIGKLTAELAQAKEAANIDVDALVANRSELVTQVKAIDAAIDPKGLTDAELRKAAVKSKLGDAAVEGVSDDVITGMYKAITLSAGESNSVRDAILGGVKTNLGDAQKMQDALEKANDFNSWRNE